MKRPSGLNRRQIFFFHNTGSNLGGAGGFHYGMRWAVEANYDYLWVMDDDCFPKTDALEKLLSADSLLKGVYGWMSSVALWTDGRECRMNRPKVKKKLLRTHRITARWSSASGTGNICLAVPKK